MKLADAVQAYEQDTNEVLQPLNFEHISENVGAKNFVLAKHYVKRSGHKVTFVYDLTGNVWELGAD